MNRLVAVVALAFVVFGLIVGGAMMQAAWDHNPQGEYWDYETGEIHWGNWLPIGIVWFTVTGGAAGLYFLTVQVLRWWRERKLPPPRRAV